MKGTLLLLTILISQVLLAQPDLNWVKNYGGSSDDMAISIENTSDGGFIIAGESSSSDGDVTGSNGWIDIFILKLDAAGNIQWRKTLGGTGVDFGGRVINTADGGYLLSGTTSSNNGFVSGNHGGNDIWIVKLSTTGAVQWKKCYGGTGHDNCWGAIQTADGNYMISGQVSSNNGDVSGNHGSRDFWAAKINQTGAIIWQKCFGGSGDDTAMGVKETLDGAFVMYGYTNSNNGDVAINQGDDDYWMVKFSSTGNLIWENTFGGSGSDRCVRLATTSDGGYMLTGETTSTNGDVSANHGAKDLWVVRADSLGDLMWSKTFGGSGIDFGADLIELPEGDFVVAGGTNSLDGDVASVSGGTDAWIIKFDPSGELGWSGVVGGTADEWFQRFQIQADGSIVAVGSSWSANGDMTSNYGGSDYLMVKYSPESLSLHNDHLGRWKVCPNPVTSSLRITGLDTTAKVTISDLKGRIILVAAGPGEIDVENLPSGLYFTTIDNGIQIFQTKFIKQ